jgi:rod shape-determining protein MreC
MYRPKRRGRLLLLVLLALSILIITLDFRGGSGGPLERVKDITQAIVSPIQRGLTTVTRPIGNFFSSIADLADLREENNRLRAEVDDLSARITEAETLADENAELRALHDLNENWASMDRVTAQVYADAPHNYTWEVVINKGSDDGIKKDMAVVTPDGLVGKTIAVAADHSTVILLIDPNQGVGATTEDRGLAGTVSGNGEGVPLKMQNVPKQAELAVGTDLYTSNFAGRTFPPGIPIGTIVAIGGDARDPELDIDVDPAVDFARLNFVYVLLETGPDIQVGEAGS